MAECAVNFVLEKLTTLLEEKVTLIRGVRQQVESVRDELQRMTAFLRVADSQEDNDPELKVWVKQVRELTYDIEDIVDEFVLQLQYSSNNSSCCPLKSCGSLIDKLIFSVRNLVRHYEIATDIQNVKSRLTEISVGHRRYGYKFNVPNQGGSSLSVGSGGGDISSRGGIDRRGDALLLEEGELVGIENPRKEIITWLLEDDSKLKVVSVVGMGGLGKTTLVKKVFDDPKVKKHFHNHAWITVSQTFDIDDLFRDTIQQLYDQVKLPMPKEITTFNSAKLKAMVKDFLSHKKYVLVFDDVWRVQDWEAIKHVLPKEDHHGSRVILTTRSMDVALSSCRETDGFVYKLNFLSEKESWTLFYRKAFKSSSTCPQHLEEICRNLMRRCGGLPLAIVAISGILSTKKETNVDDWKMLARGIGSELEGNDKLESMKNILLLSFNYLPYYLKPCYMYLSNYPEDNLIEHNTLARQWIAEGFVTPKQGRTLEEMAQGYLNELINRSLLHPVKINDDGSVKVSCIHDFYREIILLKSSDQNFTATTAEENAGFPKRVRRLSIHGDLKHGEVERYGTRLCSILLFGVNDTRSISSILQLIKRNKILKVLDLKGLPLENFPEVILDLFHLKYLSLRDTLIKKLPGSIHRLQKLEFLDLKETYITELPVGILKLRNLRQILVYHHVFGSYMPYEYTYGFKGLKGFGCLNHLQKIGFVQAYPGNRFYQEIAKLTELKRISITKIRTEDCSAMCSSIESLCKLTSLGLRASEGDYLDLQHLHSPPAFLQRLYLGGCLANFPKWVRSQQSLVKVYLRWSRLNDDPLQYLQDLPNLVHIELLDAYVGQRLCFKANTFLKLKLIGLDRLEALRSVIIEEGSMPFLEKLIIQRCRMLENVPEGIERLDNLKVVEFFDMPDEFISQLSPKSGEEYWKISRIPEVYRTYWRNDGWEVYPLEEDPKENEESDGNYGANMVKTQEQRNWL